MCITTLLATHPCRSRVESALHALSAVQDRAAADDAIDGGIASSAYHSEIVAAQQALAVATAAAADVKARLQQLRARADSVEKAMVEARATSARATGEAGEAAEVTAARFREANQDVQRHTAAGAATLVSAFARVSALEQRMAAVRASMAKPASGGSTVVARVSAAALELLQKMTEWVGATSDQLRRAYTEAAMTGQLQLPAGLGEPVVQHNGASRGAGGGRGGGAGGGDSGDAPSAPLATKPGSSGGGSSSISSDTRHELARLRRHTQLLESQLASAAVAAAGAQASTKAAIAAATDEGGRGADAARLLLAVQAERDEALRQLQKTREWYSQPRRPGLMPGAFLGNADDGDSEQAGVGGSASKGRMQAQITQLTVRVQSLADGVRSERARTEALALQKAQLEDVVAALEREVVVLHDSETDLGRQVTELSSQVTDLREQNAALRAAAAATATATAVTQRRASVAMRASVGGGAGAEAELMMLSDELVEVRAERDRLRLRVRNGEGTASKATKELAENIALVGALQEQVDSLRQSAKYADGERRALQQKLRSAESRAAEAEQAAEEARATAVEAEIASKKLQAGDGPDNEHTKIAVSKAVAAALREADARHAADKVAALRAAATASTTRIKAAREHADVLQRHASTAEARCEELSRRALEHQRERESLEAAVKELSVAAEEAQRERARAEEAAAAQVAAAREQLLAATAAQAAAASAAAAAARGVGSGAVTNGATSASHDDAASVHKVGCGECSCLHGAVAREADTVVPVFGLVCHQVVAHNGKLKAQLEQVLDTNKQLKESATQLWRRVTELQRTLEARERAHAVEMAEVQKTVDMQRFLHVTTRQQHSQRCSAFISRVVCLVWWRGRATFKTLPSGP